MSADVQPEASTAQNGLKIVCRTVTGMSVTLSVQPETDTILTVKQKLTGELGVEAGLLRIVWMGIEAQDSSVLSTLQPALAEGSVLNVAMRLNPPVAQQPPQQQQQRGGNYPQYNDFYAWQQNQHIAGLGVQDQNVMMELNLGDRDTTVLHNVHRSAVSIRFFGSFFMISGMLNVFSSLTSNGDWFSGALGGGLIVLSILAVYTAVVRTTAAARRFLAAMILFVLGMMAMMLADLFTSSPERQGNIALRVVLAIFLPIMFCSVCVWCARLHYVSCRARDRMHVNLDVPLVQAQQDPLQNVNLAVLPAHRQQPSDGSNANNAATDSAASNTVDAETPDLESKRDDDRVRMLQQGSSSDDAAPTQMVAHHL